jgi:hypothetical protein
MRPACVVCGPDIDTAKSLETCSADTYISLVCSGSRGQAHRAWLAVYSRALYWACTEARSCTVNAVRPNFLCLPQKSFFLKIINLKLVYGRFQGGRRPSMSSHEQISKRVAVANRHRKVGGGGGEGSGGGSSGAGLPAAVRKLKGKALVGHSLMVRIGKHLYALLEGCEPPIVEDLLDSKLRHEYTLPELRNVVVQCWLKYQCPSHASTVDEPELSIHEKTKIISVCVIRWVGDRSLPCHQRSSSVRQSSPGSGNTTTW